ncbi:MAG: hypothetical protein PHV75_01825 [Victivallaceae bacterium]|jgi:hypothetical protein|nr:hypothetical protein [Victivallaceae bacterium]NLK83746.1 hypothetical protein [Lentisphaerota bacterium]MDD3116198.1 hypothetical protein [Victivallaceae bacterium]MDD3704436.1 hypothetical protein [Victivallaceae bacterium]MDD4317236.1 hypothetical protein [Victivallaceae bacterium]
MNTVDFCRTQNWYPVLADYTFLTTFIKLKPEEVQALASGLQKGSIVNAVIERLRHPMDAIFGNCFVSVDMAAPTDTERFKGKRGAVHSPESAWRYLAESPKIRAAAANNEVANICIRPFRRMNQTREFRLFINDGKLSAMSQYWLLRHFRRLEGVKDEFWRKAEQFVKNISWRLPEKQLVMDIYCTSDDNILIVDLNPWGQCDPKLLHTWERDWETPTGIVLMPPPTTISGNVNVSF